MSEWNPSNHVPGHPDALNNATLAECRDQAEEDGVEREKLYSRELRLRQLEAWHRGVQEAKRNGHVWEGGPPLQFPEPLEGMRRHPATGHLLADQPRKYGP
jgi:hypothetical protein